MIPTREAATPEAAQRGAEDLFRTMADCSPVLLWLSGPDEFCYFFNTTWLKFSGRTLEEEQGEGWARGIHPDDFQRSMDIYSAALRKREAFSREYRLRRHDGEYRWLLDNGAPRFGKDGAFMGYVGSCVDIHDRRTAEEERALLLTQVQSALRQRTDFLAIASHEFRTPLTSIKLSQQLLQASLQRQASPSAESGALVERAATSALRQVARLEALLSNVAELSCPENEEVELEFSTVPLEALLGSVLERLAYEARSSGSEVRVSCEPGLRGEFDAVRVGQVLENLLSNAFKYGDGKPIDVVLQRVKDVAGDKSVLEIRVQDQGAGISPENRERIFLPFERATSYRNVCGFGLGLFVVRRIMQAHGGSLAVLSEEGAGSLFVATFPHGLL